jgi:hypothetical protein
MTDLNLTSYAITAYTPGKSGIVGYRTVPVTFKTDKVTKVKRDSMAASLPVLTKDAIVSNATMLSECVKAWCEEIQDKIVREAVLAGKSQVNADDISLDAIAAFMRESMTSGRLSGEMLQDWFTEQMEPQLTLTLAEKLAITVDSPAESHAKLEAMVTVYKTKIIALASGRTKYDKKEAGQIMRAFEVCSLVDTEDDIGAKLVQKLKVMMQAPELVDQYAL